MGLCVCHTIREQDVKYVKEFFQPKVSLNNRKFIIWKEREGVRERGVREGQHADIFKVRLGLGEIEGRDRDTER